MISEGNYLIETIIITVFLISLIISFAVLWPKRRQFFASEPKINHSSWQRLQTEFLSNVSHEIRSPLTSISGYTDLISLWAKEDGLPPRYEEILERMRQSESFLADYINSVLTFSRIKSGTLSTQQEPIEVRHFFEEINLLHLDSAVSKKLKINFEILQDVPSYLMIDKVCTQQILANLIQNGIKYTEVGGVTVRAQLVNIKPKKEGLLRIDVIDTGRGIALHDQEKIFDPFTQIDSSMSRRFGGLGLGLAICKALVQQVNGTLQIESTVGVGSMFTVQIPAKIIDSFKETLQANPFDKAKTISKDTVQPISLLKRRVLIVEDSKDNQYLVQHFLEKLDLETTVVENGKQAIEEVNSAELERREYDLILMDMQMPILDGFKATRFLRSRGYNKPIIAITAHNLEGDRERCLAAGCSDYISKPFNFKNFSEKINLSL